MAAPVTRYLRLGTPLAHGQRGSASVIASPPPQGALPTLLAAAILTCAIVLAPVLDNAGREVGSGVPWPSRSLQRHQQAHLAAELAPTTSTDLGAFNRAFHPAGRGDSLRTAGGGIESEFTSAGALLRVSAGSLRVSEAGLGRDGTLTWAPRSAPHAVGNEVRYRHGSLTELYRNGPYGLEQGFRVSARPRAGTGVLVIALRLSGSLRPRQAGAELRFSSPRGRTVLRDGALSAVDATDRQLPATMRLSGGVVELRIADNGARYPLRIDPFITQAKIPGYGGTSFGGGNNAVALSADGSTALVGAWYGPGGNAAWVFTRSGASWSEQAMLTGRESFGMSVALSADGNTALVGGGYGPEYGAARVFTRSGSTWTEQAPLEGAGSGAGRNAGFGDSVALSGDGNTALVGAPHQLPENQEGAAWVFTRTGGVWTHLGAPMLRGAGEITSPGSSNTQAEFGDKVALSSNGQVALISGWRDNTSRGAAWVFERSASAWVERGKLTGADEVGEAQFGDALALSDNGDVALIGGSGAVWIFQRAGTSWLQQGPRLTTSDDPVARAGHFGRSVALSGDGNTALFGAPEVGEYSNGAAWIFRRSGASFAQAQEFMGSTATREVRFGHSVALSREGTTALISAPGEFTSPPAGGGAAWVFVGPPWSPTGGSPLPGGSTATGPAAAPLLTHVSQSHRRWRERRRTTRSSRRIPLGTTFSFTLNEPANVSLVFTQRVTGRRVKGRCVARSRRNRRERACARMVTRGSLSVADGAGRHRIFFDGTLSRADRLPPGNCTVVITATTSAGQHTAPRQLSFTIIV